MSPMRDGRTSEDSATQLLICEPLSFAIQYTPGPAMSLNIFVCVQRIILNFDCPFWAMLIPVDPGATQLVPRLL